MGSVARGGCAARTAERSWPVPTAFRRAPRWSTIVLAVSLATAQAPFARAAAQTPVRSALAGAFTAGPFRLAFDTLGAYQVLEGGVVAVEGAYEVRGDTVVVRDTGGPLSCPPDVAGRYVWKVAAGKLTLRAIDDACVERGDGMAREWAAAGVAPRRAGGSPGARAAAGLGPIRPPSLWLQGTR